MGVLSLLHAPGRYANLRRIRALDPETDHDEILRLTARFEFPWDYSQGTGIAFMRDYGVPSIAALLDRTREFEDHGTKRYDDTILIGDEATLDGIDSPRSHAALRRLNRIHGHYDIPEDELAYVLATTLVGPVRWIEAYGWRHLDDHELAVGDVVVAVDAVESAQGGVGPRRVDAVEGRLVADEDGVVVALGACLLYTSPSPRDS